MFCLSNHVRIRFFFWKYNIFQKQNNASIVIYSLFICSCNKSFPTMPRSSPPRGRVQRVFAPLVFRTRVTPEHVITHFPLPWDTTYPPHVNGIVNYERHPVADPMARDKTKKSRPPREPNRNPPKGFDLKAELGLSGDLYKEIEVMWTMLISSSSILQTT